MSDLPLPVLISPLESFSIIVSPPVLLRRGSEKLVGWSLASHQCGITTVIRLLTTVVTSRVSTDKAKSKFSLTIYYPSNASSLSSSHYNWIILPRSSRFLFFSQGKTTYHLCLQFSSAPYFVSNDRQDFSRLPKRPISNWWIAQQQNDLPPWTKRITQSTCAMLQGLATREVTSRELMWQWFANIWKEGKRTNRSCHYFLWERSFLSKQVWDLIFWSAICGKLLFPHIQKQSWWLMAFAGRSPCLVSVRRPVLQRFLLLCWVSKWHHQTSGFQMWCYLGKDTRAKSRGKQRRKTHFFRVLAVRTVECFQDGVRLSIWSLLVPHTQFGTKGQGYGSAREKIQGSAQNRTVISDTAALYNMV